MHTRIARNTDRVIDTATPRSRRLKAKPNNHSNCISQASERSRQARRSTDPTPTESAEWLNQLFRVSSVPRRLRNRHPRVRMRFELPWGHDRHLPGQSAALPRASRRVRIRVLARGERTRTECARARTRTDVMICARTSWPVAAGVPPAESMNTHHRRWRRRACASDHFPTVRPIYLLNRRVMSSRVGTDAFHVRAEAFRDHPGAALSDRCAPFPGVAWTRDWRGSLAAALHSSDARRNPQSQSQVWRHHALRAGVGTTSTLAGKDALPGGMPCAAPSWGAVGTFARAQSDERRTSNRTILGRRVNALPVQ